MNATVAFFAFLLIAGNMIGWTLEGEQPYASTTLTSSVTDTATLIPVASIGGFPSADFIFLEGEIVSYSSVGTSGGDCSGAPACFNLASADDRGVRDTEAAAHLGGVRVYSRALGPINQAQAFGLKRVGVFNLSMDIPWVSPVAMATFVVKAITWDFIFLDGDFEMARVVLSALSIGFVFFIFYRLAPVFVDIGNMVRNFFRV